MNRKSLLVVDDDEEFLGAMARALQGAGYAVRTLRDARAVMRMIREETPDLLITDIMMPDRDGIEVIAEVRREAPAVRILVISGRAYIGSLNLLDMATSLGADGALAKPFESDRLVAKIEALLAPADRVAQGG